MAYCPSGEQGTVGLVQKAVVALPMAWPCWGSWGEQLVAAAAPSCLVSLPELLVIAVCTRSAVQYSEEDFTDLCSVLWVKLSLTRLCCSAVQPGAEALCDIPMLVLCDIPVLGLCDIAVLPQQQLNGDSARQSSLRLQYCPACSFLGYWKCMSGWDGEVGAVAALLSGKLGLVVSLLCHFTFLVNCDPPLVH